MRMVVDILHSLRRILCPALLLVCCVGLASAQSYSPFSGGSRYSNGLSVSSLNNDHVAEQAGNSRYSGLSGGRTTFDPGYQLSGGVPKSIIDNPYCTEQADENSIYGNQFRGPASGKPDPSHQLPLGDPILPLMLMLAAYAVWKRKQLKREKA